MSYFVDHKGKHLFFDSKNSKNSKMNEDTRTGYSLALFHLKKKEYHKYINRLRGAGEQLSEKAIRDLIEIYKNGFNNGMIEPSETEVIYWEKKREEYFKNELMYLEQKNENSQSVTDEQLKEILNEVEEKKLKNLCQSK